MLVLSRKVGEKLIIGDNIAVVVTKVTGNRVTLGIEAPKDVRVLRGELVVTVDKDKENGTQKSNGRGASGLGITTNQEGGYTGESPASV